MAGLNSRKWVGGWRRIRSALFGCGTALLLVSLVAAGQEAPLPQGPTLKVAVNRVSVGVTVTDSRGRFVSGLSRSDFRIFDDEIEQPIADFLPIEEPAQFLLLIESGPSVLLFAKNHILAADALVTRVGADDRVAIATYSRSPNLVLDFTADKSAARSALRSIDFHTGFVELNLFSSISSAINELAPLPGKKAIVLLSTGIDTSPAIQWEPLLEKLGTADVRIISVSLSGELRRPNKNRKLTADQKMARAELKKVFAEGDASLREVSSATGGRVFFARNAKEFDKAYAEIAELLRHEYSLAFAPTVFDGKVHRLRVDLKNKGLKVDHRPAYVAAAGEQQN